MSAGWERLVRWVVELIRPEHTTGTYDHQDDAIRAALDELPPGGTLTVHQDDCRRPRTGLCSCEPKTWTNPAGP